MSPTWVFTFACIALIGLVWLVVIAVFVRDLIVNWHRPAPVTQRRVMEHRRVNDRRRP